MVDVKEVVQGALLAWYIIIGLSVAILGWFLIMGQWSLLRQAFQAGGWVTLGFIGALLIFLLVSFDTSLTVFTGLFRGWHLLFDQSSTLIIRLFPFVFWRDAFALVLIFAL
jgi:hypothetical protein